MLNAEQLKEFLDGNMDVLFTKYPERCEESDKLIDEFDEFYRKGNPLITDQIFDLVTDYYGYKPKYYENQQLFSRKTKVPVNIGSMEKLKTKSEILDWLVATNAKDDDIMVISSKYDGIAIINNLISAWTSGKDGTGLDVSEHLKLFSNRLGLELTIMPNWYVKGEAIMDIDTFNSKYFKTVNPKDGFENPRNMMGGKLTDLIPSEILKDAVHICYSIIDENNNEPLDKVEQLQLLNQINNYPVIFTTMTVATLKRHGDIEFIEIFKNFSNQGFELDGLIIEYNSKEKRAELGYETNSFNPRYARAFKHEEFEEKAATTIVEIKRQISKSGVAVPVAVIEPVRLNGATITNIYVDNERFLAEFGVGVGSKITVKRSGMVIPRISHVEHVKIPNNKKDRLQHEKQRQLHASVVNESFDMRYELMRTYLNLQKLSKYSPFDKSIYKWDDNGVDCVLINDNVIVAKQKLVAFFETVGAFGVSDGIIEELYNNGYNTLETILSLKPSDLQILRNWDEKKAINVYQSIQKSITNVPLEIVQHASGMFDGLGSKKLVLLKHFRSKPTIEQVKQIDGFADITAKIYVDNYDEFWLWLSKLPITIALEHVVQQKSTRLEGKSFVFTGFRSAILEKQIKEHGGEIKSSVSSKVTYLVMKQVGSGSTKEQNAKKLGISILDESMLKSMLQVNTESDGALF